MEIPHRLGSPEFHLICCPFRIPLAQAWDPVMGPGSVPVWAQVFVQVQNAVRVQAQVREMGEFPNQVRDGAQHTCCVQCSSSGNATMKSAGE